MADAAGTCDPLARLRRLADGSSEDARWLRARLAEYGGDVTLDGALGLTVQPGQRRPATVEAMAARDEWLRELRRVYYSDLSRTAAAAVIASLARSYLAAGWRFDRFAAAPPNRILATPKFFIWHALKCREAGFPISARRIVTILLVRD